MRQAASASGVSPFVVRRWISQGVLDEPPWTLYEVQKARDIQQSKPPISGGARQHSTLERGLRVRSLSTSA